MIEKKYAGYLVDLDGTMYNGNARIDEAEGFIERLRESGKPFLFLTNNSTASPLDVCENLMIRSNVTSYPEEVFTSTEATIRYLKELKAQRLHVIGDVGLKKGLKEAGFELAHKDVECVVVGYDNEVTFEQFKDATLLIQAGARFIGTNPDTNIPTEEGLVPGNGALLAFLEASTGIKPEIMGKPEASMMHGALDKLGLEKEEVLMVGDNYTTDIQAGIRNGIDTLLVLTGFTQEEDLPNLPTPATYVINTLDDWEIK